MPDATPAAVDFAPPEIEVRELPGGGYVCRSPRPLEDYPPSLGHVLYRWAEAAPDRVFLAERDGEEWRRISYADFTGRVERIAQGLIERGLGPERPVMILSDNSIDNAALLFAAMHAAIPVAPVSPAYSLMSSDHGKLRYIFDLVRPGLVYAQNGTAFAKALNALNLADAELVVSVNPPSDEPATAFADLAATRIGPEVARAFAQVGPDTAAKILFTSGSTGEPKGVINTHRMMCSNQQAIAQLWRFLHRRPPVIVDWLPWNHTFGGNYCINMVLFHGGTLHIDDGKPVPGLIERTVRNLREVPTTMYFNVPRGFDALAPYLEQDEGLRETFFRELDILFFAAAALPQNLWELYDRLSVSVRGARVPFVSAWGATETAPDVTLVHYAMERASNIGLPIPGTELKLVPDQEKLEMRVRGPNVTPGYFKRDDLTRAAFDADGFYLIGDAGRFADPDDPSKGIEFDGRTAENFKLSSGTWVHVGTLRVAAIAAGAPLIQDAVVAGHDRDEVGLLVFPNRAACRALCPELAPEAPAAEIIAQARVRSALAEALLGHNAQSRGSSTVIARALLLDEPPSIDSGEITDKGYINQRRVLERRAVLVARLYSDDPAVIRIPAP